jgi:excisionase family DNA binding protein
MQIDAALMTVEAPPIGGLEPLMTAEQVAAALGVSRKFVYARHRAGALRGYKLGPHYRFRLSDVQAFLEASVAAPAERHERRREPRPAPVGSFRALRRAAEQAS